MKSIDFRAIPGNTLGTVVDSGPLPGDGRTNFAVAEQLAEQGNDAVKRHRTVHFSEQSGHGSKLYSATDQVCSFTARLLSAGFPSCRLHFVRRCPALVPPNVA